MTNKKCLKNKKLISEVTERFPEFYQLIKHLVNDLQSAFALLVNIIYIIESKHFKIKIIITYTLNCLYNALRIYQSE